MPTFSSLAALGANIDKLRAGLDDDAIAKAVGVMAKKEAEKVAQDDLSDGDFSGWRRGKPIKLTVRFDVVEGGKVLVKPNRQNAGPWTVAERGRNHGNASGFSGPGINNKTGDTARTKAGNVRKVRGRKARRWNGYTAGLGTASKANKAIEDKAPDTVDAQIIKVTRKFFDLG